MNSFQNESFHSVEEMLDFLPPAEREIVDKLRDIIFSCIPDAKEKLSYNVPYYYRHSRICFIWPASVPWGGVREGVQLGFCKGHLLADVGYLEAGKRKTVFTRTFHTTKEIDREMLCQLLYEAACIDAGDQKAKKANKH